MTDEEHATRLYHGGMSIPCLPAEIGPTVMASQFVGPLKRPASETIGTAYAADEKAALAYIEEFKRWRLTWIDPE